MASFHYGSTERLYLSQFWGFRPFFMTSEHFAQKCYSFR